MLDFTKELKGISGKNDKIEALSRMIAKDPIVAKVCHYALNPFFRYGFKKLPTPKTKEDITYSWDIIFATLDLLRVSNRSDSTVELLADLLGGVDVVTRVVVSKIVLKNLDCGVQESTFNSALKKSGVGMEWEVKGYPCMLVASDFEKYSKKLPWETGVFSQEKCDGMRVNAIVCGSSVEFFGRSGKPITILSTTIAEECIKARDTIGYDCVLDGELLVMRDGKVLDRKTGNGILNKAVRGTISVEESECIVQTVWDVIPLATFEKGEGETLPYSERFETIKEAIVPTFSKLRLVDSKIVHSKEEALEDFKVKLSEGKEGVIVKHPENRWKDSRVTDCLKLKAELDCDLKVVGWEEGTGKYAGMLGALLCESSDGMVKVSVGSGFTEEERKSIKPEDVLDKVITVLYNARIKDKDRATDSLFLPRFVEIRSDKSTANASVDIA